MDFHKRVKWGGDFSPNNHHNPQRPLLEFTVPALLPCLPELQYAMINKNWAGISQNYDKYVYNKGM